MRVIWTIHAEERAQERQIPVQLVDNYVGKAQFMPTFEDNNNQMCWMPLGDCLVRVVFYIEDGDRIIVTVFEENSLRKSK